MKTKLKLSREISPVNMSPKRKINNSVSPSSNKRSKNFSDLQTKIKMIEQSEEGARTSDITKNFNLPWSTVGSIVKKSGTDQQLRVSRVTQNC